MDRPKILAVDDEPVNVEFLKAIFEDAGCEVICAYNGKEAVEKAKSEKPDIILLDVIMPVMDGFEACRVIKEDPDTTDIPVIIITALGDRENKIKGFESGADEYITKPFDKHELLLRVRNMLKIKKYNDLLKDYSRTLEEEVSKRTQELIIAYEKLDQAYLELVHRLGRAAEYRDDETGEHTKRVGEMSAILARRLGLDKRMVKVIQYATPMHDVGKIGIPDSILLKPGKLTPEEFEIMKKHTLIGADILSGSDHPVLKTAEQVALTHHERWDGQGYPQGLRGEEIPLEGRICSLIDFFDACTSDRIYRPAMDIDVVIKMIKEEKEKHFDPYLVDLFLQDIEEFLEVKRKYSQNGLAGRYKISDDFWGKR